MNQTNRYMGKTVDGIPIAAPVSEAEFRIELIIGCTIGGVIILAALILAAYIWFKDDNEEDSEMEEMRNKMNKETKRAKKFVFWAMFNRERAEEKSEQQLAEMRKREIIARNI